MAFYCTAQATVRSLGLEHDVGTNKECVCVCVCVYVCMYVSIYLYIYACLGHFAVQLKLKEHCKSTIFFILVFLGPHSWHMDVPRLGVELEL